MNIGIIKLFSSVLPLKTFYQVCKALVRPHLDYCDVIYPYPSKVRSNWCCPEFPDGNGRKVQYQSALAVTGAWQGPSRYLIVVV